MTTTTAQLILSSESSEWYTPESTLGRVYDAFQQIPDLDPCCKP